jgi:aspartokinase-like uncharacterized kinase
MKAKKLDKAFDSGKSVVKHLDLSRAARAGNEQRRVNVDFPAWMVESLDREAHRLGVTRQSIIKVWIAERLQVSTTVVAQGAAGTGVKAGAAPRRNARG